MGNSQKYRTDVYVEGEFTLALYLRILNLEAQDFGHYTCEGENSLGSDKETLLLYGRSNVICRSTCRLILIIAYYFLKKKKYFYSALDYVTRNKKTLITVGPRRNVYWPMENDLASECHSRNIVKCWWCTCLINSTPYIVGFIIRAKEEPVELVVYNGKVCEILCPELDQYKVWCINGIGDALFLRHFWVRFPLVSLTVLDNGFCLSVSLVQCTYIRKWKVYIAVYSFVLIKSC